MKYQFGLVVATAAVAAFAEVIPNTPVSVTGASLASERALIDFGGKRTKLRPELFSSGLGGQLIGPEAGQIGLIKGLNLTAARTHDWALANAGERLIDVHFIFPLLHADASDPRNYYFGPTDDILSQTIEELGLKVMYQLGSSIESFGARRSPTKTPNFFNSLEPNDWDQFVKASSGIIRHYTEGWANGKHWKNSMPWWELWSEPNDVPGGSWLMKEKNFDPTLNRERFCEFFVYVLSRLKKEFPDLKFGGPALCNADMGFMRAVLEKCKEKGYKPDFISWHGYGFRVDDFFQNPPKMRALCDELGFKDTELCVNEWHYIPGYGVWNDLQDATVAYKPLTDPVTGMGGIESGVFVLQMFAGAQSSVLDHFYYYGCGQGWAWCDWGIRARDGTLNKTYYALKMFGSIIGNCDTFVKSEDRYRAPVRAFGAFAKDGKKAYLLVTSYRGYEKTIDVEVRGLSGKAPSSVLVLDKTYDLAPAQPGVCTWRDGRLTFVKPDQTASAYLVEFPL